MTWTLPEGVYPFVVDGMQVRHLPATDHAPAHDVRIIDITILGYETAKTYIVLHQLISSVWYIKKFARNVGILKESEPLIMSKILDCVGCFGRARFTEYGDVIDFIDMNDGEEIS